MFSFSTPELILVLVIALVVFGPGKLPEIGKAIGKGLNEFRQATTMEDKKDTTPNDSPKDYSAMPGVLAAEQTQLAAKVEEKK